MEWGDMETTPVGKGNCITPWDEKGEQKIEYNYEAMWDKLWREMEYLMQKNVHACDPAIVLGYMGFISQEERLKAQIKQQQGGGNGS